MRPNLPSGVQTPEGLRPPQSVEAGAYHPVRRPDRESLESLSDREWKIHTYLPTYASFRASTETITHENPRAPFSPSISHDTPHINFAPPLLTPIQSEE